MARISTSGPFSAALDLIVTAKSVSDSLGKVVDQVVVTVTGTPTSTRRALYFLAAAVGFGLVQRLVPAGGAGNPFGSPGRIGISYNAELKEVTFNLMYEQSLTVVGMTVAATDIIDVFRAGLGRPPAAPVSPFSLMPVLNGPKDTIIGAPWDFAGPVVVRLPTPSLPFAGRIVLTDALVAESSNPAVPLATAPIVPTENPRPAGDARSRGSLCWLVWQNLANPVESLDGSGSHTFVPPTNANRFNGG